MTKGVPCEVKRLKNFILGLLIVAIVGFLLFMYIKDSRIKSYQDYFLQFNWFQPLLIGACWITNIDWSHISTKHIQTNVSQTWTL